MAGRAATTNQTHLPVSDVPGASSSFNQRRLDNAAGEVPPLTPSNTPSGMPTTKLDKRVATVLQNAAKKRANMGWRNKFWAFWRAFFTMGVKFKDADNHWALDQAAKEAKIKLPYIIAEAPKHLSEVPTENLKFFFNALSKKQKSEFLKKVVAQIQGNLSDFRSVYAPSGETGQTEANPAENSANLSLELARTFVNNAQALLASEEGDNFLKLRDRMGKIRGLVGMSSFDILLRYGMNLSTKMDLSPDENVAAFQHLCHVLSEYQIQEPKQITDQVKQLTGLAASGDQSDRDALNNLACVFLNCGKTCPLLTADQVGQLTTLAVSGDQSSRKALNDLAVVLEGRGYLLDNAKLNSLVDLAAGGDDGGREALNTLASVLNLCADTGRFPKKDQLGKLANLVVSNDGNDYAALNTLAIVLGQCSDKGQFPDETQVGQLVKLAELDAEEGTNKLQDLAWLLKSGKVSKETLLKLAELDAEEGTNKLQGLAWLLKSGKVSKETLPQVIYLFKGLRGLSQTHMMGLVKLAIGKNSEILGELISFLKSKNLKPKQVSKLLNLVTTNPSTFNKMVALFKKFPALSQGWQKALIRFALREGNSDRFVKLADSLVKGPTFNPHLANELMK